MDAIGNVLVIGLKVSLWALYYFHVTYNNDPFVCIKCNLKDERRVTPHPNYVLHRDKGLDSLTYITLGFQNTSTHIYQLVFRTTLQDVISMLEMKKHN